METNHFSKMHPQICFIKVSILCYVALIDSFGYTLLVNVIPSMVDPNDPLFFAGVSSIASVGTSYTLLQFSFVLGGTVFPPCFGYISDKTGRRLTLCVLLAVLSLVYWRLSRVSSLTGFLLLRLLSGVTGGLRPVAISYIADMVKNECTRGRLVSSLSLVAAFSVGLGPSIGAQLAKIDKSYPFLFMSGLALIGLVMVTILLPETPKLDATWSRSRKPSIHSSILYSFGDSVSSRQYASTYRLLLILGFSTYFMAMMGAVAFPLSLKDSFGFDPITAGLCSIGDGPLIFVSNLMFMNRFSHSLSVACKASAVACLSFVLIHFVPITTSIDSLPLFLSLKYLTSAAAPIAFCAIPQILINICPLSSCGAKTGVLSASHGAGRLLATALVGPLFSLNPGFVYSTVAVTGVVSAVVFLVLHSSLTQLIGKEGITTPLLFGNGSVVQSAATSPRAASPNLERSSSVALTLLMPDVSTVETAAAVLLQQMSTCPDDSQFTN